MFGRARISHCFLLVTSLCLCHPSVWRCEALTIHRIGGEHIDPPMVEVDGSEIAVTDPQAEAAAIIWQPIEWKAIGTIDNLESAEGFLQPARFDPEHNLTPDIRGRGGSIQASDTYTWRDEPALDLLFDGDETTAYEGLSVGGGFSLGSLRPIWVKFNGLIPVDRMVMRPTPEGMNERFIRRYTIGTNDGDPLKRGTREGKLGWRDEGFVDYEIRYDVSENTARILDLKMPVEPIAEIIIMPEIGSWEIAELEIYADGFVSSASYVSNIINLNPDGDDDFDPVSLGDLTWSGHVPEGTRLDLSMRSGDQEDPFAYWRVTFRGDERTRYDERGRLLDRKAYDKLGGHKGGTSLDSQHWGTWTPPLVFEKGRAPLVGAKPRQFVQFRADFHSTKADAGATLDFLQFEITNPPLATQVLAEITPAETDIGEITSFTYKVRPLFDPNDLFFDSIQIDSPTEPVSVDSVRISRKDLTRVPFGDTVEKGEFAVGPYADGSFVVQLPRIDLEENRKAIDKELIEVVFRSEVFRVGTIFSGRVFDTKRPYEVHQRLTPGDADELAESNSLTVQPRQVGADVIRSLRVSPFTPNGDGINDRLAIEYDLVNVDAGVPVALAVYDLTGRMVAGVSAPAGDSGRFPADWDGRDDGGALVPPGLYLIRLEVETDRNADVAVATVPVVY